MLTQSSLVQEALLVNEKVLAPEKPSHRTSIFKEIDDVPRLWGRESQSGYRGKRALTLCSDGEKDYSIDSAPGCHDALATFDIGRQPMPADYGYEMPERYGGKEVAYGDHPFKLLAGNNNTWVPPYEQRKKICGFGQMAFWIMFGILCLLVVSGAIAAGFVAASSSRSTTSHKSSPSSPIDISAPFEPSTQTSLTSRTNTMTLPNSAVVLTTEVITSVHTITPQPTSKSQTSPSPTITPPSGLSAAAALSTAPGPASPTSPESAAPSSVSPEPVSPSTVPATPTVTTPTLTLLVTSHTPSPQIL